MTRILYCGSRDWIDRQMIRLVMVRLVAAYPGHTVVHGGARGADTQVHLVAGGLNLFREVHRADWKNLPKWEAGPKRNQEMLDTGVDMVVAFKDGFNHKMNKGGTEDMVRRAVLADVPTCLYAHDLGAPYTFEAHEDEAQATPARVQRRDEGSGQATLWEHMRDPDVSVTGVPFPPSQAAPPR